MSDRQSSLGLSIAEISSTTMELKIFHKKMKLIQGISKLREIPLNFPWKVPSLEQRKLSKFSWLSEIFQKLHLYSTVCSPSSDVKAT